MTLESILEDLIDAIHELTKTLKELKSEVSPISPESPVTPSTPSKPSITQTPSPTQTKLLLVGHDVIIEKTPKAKALADFVQRFAKLNRASRDVLVFTIDRLSLWKAAERHTPDEVIEFLKLNAKSPPPDSLKRWIFRTMSMWDQLRIKSMENFDYLEAADEKLMDRILSMREVKSHIFRRLTPTTARIIQGHRGELKQALLEKGYPIKDLGRYEEFPPLKYELKPEVTQDPRYQAYQKEAVEEFLKYGSGTIVLPGGSGKCVAKGTLIDTALGLIPVEEIRPKTFTISYDRGLGTTLQKEISAFYDMGDSDTVIVETALGSRIEVTPEHPLLTPTGWKKAQELKIGDYVAILMNTPFPLKPPKITIPVYNRNPHATTLRTDIILPRYMNEDLAFITGLILAEGPATKVRKNSLYVCNVNSKLLQDFKEKVHRVFGYKTRSREYPNTFGGTLKYEFIHSAIICHYMISSGLVKLEGKENLEVPSLILKSPRNIVKQFIRGFFLGDGSLYQSGKDSWEIELSAKSEKLIRQLQIILFKFGIVSRVCSRNQRTHWRLLIYDNQHVKKFCDVFNIPAPKLKLPDIKFSDRLVWVRVKKISKGKAKVYDVTVEGTHSFVANGFISHNTVIAVMVAAKLQAPTLVLVTRAEIAEQFKKEFLTKTTISSYNVACIHGQSRDRTVKPITICTYQIASSGSLARELWNRKWGLVVYDESQHIPGKIWSRTTRIQAIRRLGLTATPIREDKQEKLIFSLIGPGVYEKGWVEMAEEGFIAKAKAYEVLVDMPERIARRYSHTTDEREKYILASTNPGKLPIVKKLLQKHEDDKVLILGYYVQGALELGKKLGIPVIYGEVSAKQRHTLYNKFRNGEIKRLILTSVGEEGVDLPDANVLIEVCGLYGSRMQMGQRFGRILRPKKKGSIFYEIVSRGTMEEDFSQKRRAFLISKGYEFSSLEVNEL